jgi:hypothetical protein
MEPRKEAGSRSHRFAMVLCFVCCLSVGDPQAQELEPRAYWIAPVGTNSVYFIFAHSRGDFVTDPSLPVEDVVTRLNSSFIGYYRALEFFGRSANFTVTAPYYWGTIEGLLEGEPQSISRSGMADVQFRFSANLLGGQAMNIPQFQEFRKDPGTILGASIRIQPPTGQYDSDRLINLGTNRWSFKPQIGLIQPIQRRFAIELSLAAWFFTGNEDFLGSTRKQDPLLASAFNFVWRIRPAFWASLDTTYYYGGRTTVDDELRSDLQRNSRIGATVAVPFGGRHILKFSASTGFFVSFGGNYDSFAASYQFGWFSGQ